MIVDEFRYKTFGFLYADTVLLQGSHAYRRQRLGHRFGCGRQYYHNDYQFEAKVLYLFHIHKYQEEVFQPESPHIHYNHRGEEMFSHHGIHIGPPLR